MKRRYGKRNGQRSAAKQRQGERSEPFSGSVRDLNSQGHGVVARDDGHVFFVPGVWPGEEGVFEVTGTKGRIGFAQALKLTHPSPDRVDPPCPHHGFSGEYCGGCPWQFMSYPAQLQAKAARVTSALAGLCQDELIAPIWGSPQALGYRNRAQFKSDGKQLGYMAAGSRNIVDITACPILNERNQQTLADLRQRLPEPAWRPARQRAWSTLHIDDDVTADTITPEQRRPFRQGNTEQNQRMIQWLEAQLAALNAPPAAVELFAGSGNFTQVMAKYCSSVLAVDSFAPAIEELAARELRGVTATCADLARRDGVSQLDAQCENATLLVLDPPRDGFAEMGSYLTRAVELTTVLYISCDLATYRRDAQVLLASGFTLESVQPVDLFPQTPHVELLTVLRR